VRRAVLASGGSGALDVDTLKNNHARTVPLVVGASEPPEQLLEDEDDQAPG